MITNGGPDIPILLVLPQIDVTNVGAKSRIPVKNVTLFFGAQPDEMSYSETVPKENTHSSQI